MKIRLLIFLFISHLSFTSFGQLVINEYSAANFDGFADNYGDFEDWFELHNPTAAAIDLSGYYLSDKPTNLTKWQMPGSLVIPANGVRVIYCSGRDELIGNNAHTNFKLTQTKGNEWIILTDPNGTTIVDSLFVKRCQTNHSRGRDSNGSASWGVFSTPTPNGNNTGAFLGYAEKPNFSIAGGYYAGSANVTLSTTTATNIFYTDNGDFPDNTTNAYAAALTLNATTILKARAYSTNPNILPSFIEYHTYFVNNTHTMPIVSISGTDIADLIQNGNGWGADPEGTFEYFEANGDLIDKARGDFNKHGNDSWAYDQRGFDYITRDQFGYNHEIQDSIFRTKDRKGYQRLIIKAAANDNYPFSYGGTGAHIRDAYVNSLSQVADLRLDERSYEPCIVYMNGQYWGLYEIREKVDDIDFTDYYYKQGKEDVDFLKTWGGTWIEYGSDTGWTNISNFVLNNDMSIDANYQHAKKYFNMGSLTDYFILNMYVVCADWLNWNTAWWRGRNPNGSKKKWRYALWDMDNTFGHGTNYTGLPSQDADADPCDPDNLGDPGGQGHVPMWNALLENEEFFDNYINRWADLKNTHFSCDFMIQHLDSLIDIIEPEMNGQINLWGGNYTTWESNVQDMKDFILERCSTINAGFVDCYDVTGPYNVTVIIEGIGEVDLSGITINQDNSPWSGEYFGGVNLPCIVQNGNFTMYEVIADSTYIYDPFDPNLIIDLVCDVTIIVHFDASLVTYMVEPAGKGDISINGSIPPSYPHTELHLTGSTVNLEGLPNPGQAIVNWTSQQHNFSPNNTDAQVSLEPITSDTVILHLEPIVYPITYNVVPGHAEGIFYIDGDLVTDFPHTRNYYYNDQVEVRTEHTPYWEFERWTSLNQSVPNGTEEKEYSFTVRKADEIYAHFEEIIYYDVIFDIQPKVEAGDIRFNNIPDYLDFPLTKTFRAGDELDLEAIENEGWRFQNWTSNFNFLSPNKQENKVNTIILGDDHITAHYDEILDVYIPNSFTPGNGDTRNNTFDISVYSVNDFSFNIRIYNRWGEELFRSESLDDRWDGTHPTTGKLVPMGTYTYVANIISSTGKHLQRNGSITVIN
jgi:gliding motility-associated-like protein